MAAILYKQSWYVDPEVFYEAEVALTGDEDAEAADYDKSVIILP